MNDLAFSYVVLIGIALALLMVLAAFCVTWVVYSYFDAKDSFMRVREEWLSVQEEAD